MWTPRGQCCIRRKIRLIKVSAKCRHLKNWPVKALCGRCLSEYTDWRFLAYIQSRWYFQSSFVICTLSCCPSPLLSGSTLPLPPSSLCELVCILYTRRQCVRGGVLDLRQINTCRKVPLRLDLNNISWAKKRLIKTHSKLLIKNRFPPCVQWRLAWRTTRRRSLWRSWSSVTWPATRRAGSASRPTRSVTFSAPGR